MTLRAWTRPTSYAGADWFDWFSGGVGRSRDSRLLEASNFDTAWKRINAASLHLKIESDDNCPGGDSCQIVEESHWAVGWVRWIAIHKSDTGALAEAELIDEEMSNYPVLDEEDSSLREYEATIENILDSLTMLGFGKDENLAKDICNWLSRNDDYALENTDDTGAWVPDEKILEAIEGVCQNKTRREMDMRITDETVRFFHKEN
jgi:hypothetical protein